MQRHTPGLGFAFMNLLCFVQTIVVTIEKLKDAEAHTWTWVCFNELAMLRANDCPNN
jgi:uncharacterized membrane protein YhaH (DUF805 family)